MTLIFLHKASAQKNDLNEEIEKHRKGELIIHAKTGDKVMVEQLENEFWFGAAISDGMVSGSMSAEDIIQYKEKFLENFNSAVTENALKWPKQRNDEINFHGNKEL